MLLQRNTELAVMDGHGPLGRPLPQQRPIAGRSARLCLALWRRAKLITALTGGCVALAIVYLHIVTPLYACTSKLLIQHRAVKPASLALQSTDGDSTGQRAVITSTPVLAAALGDPEVREIAPLRNRRDALAYLKKELKVDTDRNEEFVSVSFDAADPGEGTRLVSAVVDAYLRFQSSLRFNGNKDALVQLRDARSRREAELADKAADLFKFAQANHVSADGGKSSGAELVVQSLSDAVNNAHVETIKAQAASDELNRSLQADPDRAAKLAEFLKSTPAAMESRPSDDDVIHSELLALKARQAELQQRFMPGHPSLVGIDRQISTLNLSLDAGVQRKLAVTKEREADLRKSYEDEQKLALEHAAQQAEYVRRSGELSESQKSINAIDANLRDLESSNDDLTVPTVTVLEPARASEAPTYPNRRRVYLSALGGGLCLSVLLALFLEGAGRRLSVEKTPEGFGMPVLAELPRLPTDFTVVASDRRERINATADRSIDSGDNWEADWEGGWDAGASDALNDLHAIVEGGAVKGRGATVLITSPARGDGKSTLASNLAVSLALKRKRVLLVDADFRNRAQARIFGLNDPTGLATLLESTDPIVITAIHHTATPSLDVVPCGPTTRNPAEMLNTQKFTDILNDLAERYDIVLLDSPPTVTFSDARTIAASCDLTLMVMRTGNASRRLFDLATEGLTNVGANLCGVVLNSGMDPQHIISPRVPFTSPPNHLEATPPAVHRDSDSSVREPRKLNALLRSAAEAINLARWPANETDRQSEDR